jgi:peptide-methionine (R)-S-oxide reductase
MITRRTLFLSGTAALAMGSTMSLFGKTQQAEASSGAFAVSYSEDEWKKRLSPEAFYVLRKHGTERPGSSPLNHEKRTGVFHCAGCEQALFRSEDKFESGTGWPSFTQPINGAVGESTDRSFFMTRTEVHCSRCGGHLGHVFPDGPKPTGLRYCMNGVALAFKPGAAQAS